MNNNRNTAAFFDVDETLINIKSMLDFLMFYCRQPPCQEPSINFIAVKDKLTTLQQAAISREQLNREYYKVFIGVSWSYLMALGRSWFASQPTTFYQQPILDRLRHHQTLGDTVIFVSGSFIPCLKPIADDLGVKHILCSDLILINDLVTGDLNQQVIGHGKSQVIKKYAKKNNISLIDSFAYGDDISDVSMLKSVGHPVAVGHCPQLLSISQAKKWAVIPL